MPNERTPKPNPERSADQGDDPKKNPPREKGQENLLSSEYEEKEKQSKSQETPSPGQSGATVIHGDGPEEKRDKGHDFKVEGNLHVSDKEKEHRGHKETTAGNRQEHEKQEKQKGSHT